MSKRKYFRRIYAKETKAEFIRLRAKYPNCAEPDWRNCWVLIESIKKPKLREKILALVEFEQRTCINTLDADNPTAALEVISWSDGYLANFEQYEFAVPASNKQMHKALLRHYGLEGEVEPPHRVYVIRRQ